MTIRDTEPALIYVMTHPGLGAVKIGISEADGTRIAQHRRAGWHLTVTVRVSGRGAVSIERAILRWWRTELGLPIYLKPGDMPQGGYTETVALRNINVTTMAARVCDLALRPEVRPHPA